MNNFQKLTLFFCTGIVSVQWLIALPSIFHLIIGAIAALLAYRWASGLSFLILGFVWAAAYSSLIHNNQLPNGLESKEILIRGQVIDLPAQDVRSIKFLFKVDEVITPIGQLAFPNKLRLSWYDRSKQVRSGEKWQFLVKLKRPHGLSNPHGFDYEKWIFQHNIGATGYVRKADDNKRLTDAPWWSVGRWRESLKDYLDIALAGNQHIGVIKALVLGDRSDISVDQWDVFRKTGTSHLIAISGLHIGLISALVFAVFRWFGLRISCLRGDVTRLAILASLLSAILYAALAGFSVPTQRALIMVSVVLGGIFWQRYYRPFHVISVALVAVLIIDPLAPMSAGFWLSFGAVGVILYAGTGRIKKPTFVTQLLQVQSWVFIGLVPLVLYFFQQVSLLAPLANVIAVPFVSFAVVPLLLIALLLSLFHNGLGLMAFNLVAYLVDVLWVFLDVISKTSFSSMSLSPVSLIECLIAMVGVTLLLMPKGLFPKPVACLLFLPLLSPTQSNELAKGEFKLVLLDVGQGLSAVIHTADNVLIFDAGAKYSEKSDLASTVILPYLNGEGIKKLERLIISHGDNDHAGGAKTLLKNIPVNSLMTSVPELFRGHKPVSCKEGISWRLDGVNFEFLAPDRNDLFEGNNASCVLKISSVNGSVLLPGDIEKNTERSLVQYKREKLKADVLIAPHHGSKTSSTIEFLEAINPRYVLYPVGYKNRFGFPNKMIIDRYKKERIRGFDTATDGALTVRFYDGLDIRVESFRSESSKFWNWRL
jgi:competence protein ComEC